MFQVGPGGPREARAGFAGDPRPGPEPRPRVQLGSVDAAPRRVIGLRPRGARSFLSQSELALVRLFVLGGWFFFFQLSILRQLPPGTLSGPQLSPLPQAPSALLPITFLFYSHDFVWG